MNDIFGQGPVPPAKAAAGDIFGPRPEELERSLDAVKSQFGGNSAEFASALVQLGDAHMIQGRLSNPRAQANYEQALLIFRTQGEVTPQTAWVYDKLANVKNSSGDTVGAGSDLATALNIWKRIETGSIPNFERHINRRTEDLARLVQVNLFKARRPPDI